MTLLQSIGLTAVLYVPFLPFIWRFGSFLDGCDECGRAFDDFTGAPCAACGFGYDG